jgi:hypothetical protein
MTLKKQDLQAYRERWQAVAEVETRESQQASIAQRWRQFNAILRMAVALELTMPQDDIGEIIAIRQRWQRLQEILL